ncbi:restriction endonuclease subunit S [Aeromonas media]|uniref:restriction endonuclease subunit S n=1 Tax=Aeromonas media TaxID=651 RepID=UPI000AD0496A|nr:restriction endonuclease subunit S [Aeromonas media]MBS4638699.1 restriction endonuclease subunit S [Aeromonas media]
MSEVVAAAQQGLTGKYQPYPEYKDSGVEWLGDVPEHWVLSRVKDVAVVFGGYPFDSQRFSPDVGVPLIRIRDINTELTAVYFDGDVPQEAIVENNDVLIGMDGEFNVARWKGGKAALNQRVACVRTYSDELTTLLFYTLPFSLKVVNDLTYYTTVKHLSLEDIKKTIFALPQGEELSNIVAFLDYETARIDRLIAQQQRLIELLKEKRQAVISHAVTKGLNPNAPMKNSGIEWLGQVPEHWDVCLIKYKCDDITDGAHTSPETEGGQELFVSIKDIKDGVIEFERALLTSSESYQHLVKSGCQPFAGDILFSKDGTIGQTAVTPDGISFVVASSLIIIRPNRSVVRPSFLNFLLQSCATKEQVESFVKGAALRRLSIQNLLKVFGVFPSLYEQDAISGYLETTLAHYSELESKAFQAISLMQERRTALISAAVTGKIDLRGWTPPAEEVAA